MIQTGSPQENTWGGGTTGFSVGEEIVRPSPEGFAILIMSLTVWILSLWLLSQAVETVKWAFRRKRGSREPESGKFLSQGMAVAVVLVWCAWVVMTREIIGPGWTPFGHLPSDRDVWVLPFLEPRLFAPGFLLGSLVPSFVALFKFAMTGFETRRMEVGKGTVSTRWVAIVVRGGFAALNIAASIVTLAKAL